MDIASISAAWAALKTAKDTGKALLDLHIDTEVRLKVSEMLDRLGETQDRLFQLREDLDRLQANNSSLRAELSAVQAWDARLSRYTLIKTPGGGIVYESVAEPKHYACPSCMESRTVQPLQDTRTYGGTFVCPKCDKRFPVRVARGAPHRQSKMIPL